MFASTLDIHPEIRIALDSHYPVVALESTIITHGIAVMIINSSHRHGVPNQRADSPSSRSHCQTKWSHTSHHSHHQWSD